jgi:hypothetical protein
MAGIKISALPAASSSALTDAFPALQTGVTVRETLQQVLTLFNSNVQLASPSQVTGLNAQLATYLPLAGGTMAGALILNTNSPVTSLQAASKGYVDTVASGFTVILACAAATTVNLNATQAGAGVGATLTNAGAMAAFSVDGYSASLNDRILVKNQTLSQHNGIYVVTTLGSGAANWVLTRSTDYDQATEIKPGSLVAVNNGTVNASTSWLETATVVTVDTDPVLFSQFTFAPSGFLMVANNLSDVANVSTSRTNLGLGTAATKTASDNTKTNVAMVNGTPSVGNIAVFADVAGTVKDGGAPINLLFNFMSTGRLTLTSGVPVTTSDVTGAPIVYYTPYTGNQISLFDGVSTWNTLPFGEIAVAVPGTANTMYDAFIYNNLGTCSMELQTWTNDTTRAISLSLQNGVYVKSSDKTRRYVGSFRTTGTVGQTEDSYAKRYVWNYCNREMRPMKAIDATPTWAYSTNAYRQSNGNTANQLDFVVGVVEESVYINASSEATNSTGTGRPCSIGIGIDSTTVNSATKYDANFVSNIIGFILNAYYDDLPTAGRHFYAWLEKGAGTDTQTWSGTKVFSGTSLLQTGIIGHIRG